MPTDVVGKAGAILRAFTRQEPELTLVQVSNRVGLPKATTHRLLLALMREEFIYQDPTTRRYRIGLGLVQIAAHVLHHDDLAARAAVHLRRLQATCGENVSLQLRVGNERLCVYEVESQHALRMTSGIGRVRPLCAGAAGKAILAYLPEAEQDAVLTAYAATLPVSKRTARIAAVREDLVQTRARSYGTSQGENTLGATALATPVFDAGRVVGAVNISGPESRWTLEAMLLVIEPLLYAAGAISTIAGLPVTMTVSA